MAQGGAAIVWLDSGKDAMASHIQLLVTRLRELPDPRQSAKFTFPLVEMALTCVAGGVADCDGWEDIAEFGQD